MTVEKRNTRDFLTGDYQYAIPAYQRSYSWQEDNWERFFEDVLAIGQKSKDDDKATHFMGSVVCTKSVDNETIAISQLVDGQQRLTSLYLLIIALLKKSTTPRDKGTLQDYLTNRYIDKTDPFHYHLRLNPEDQLVFKILVETTLNDLDSDHKSYNESLVNLAYGYFLNRVSAEVFDDLMLGIRKLLFVYIILEDNDDVQLIFETLNSTGKDLLQSDLVHNYLLMNVQEVSKQVELNNNYWLPMMKMFQENAGQFDDFMRTFLIIKTKQFVKERFYLQFKAIYPPEKDGTVSTSNILKELSSYAKYYNDIFNNEQADKELQNALNRYIKLKMSTWNPFILRLYIDYARQKLAKADFINMLSLVSSYIVRRAVAGFSSSIYANLVPSLYDTYIDNLNYVASFIGFFKTTIKDSHKFPSNKEILESLKSIDFYSKRRYRLVILLELENYGRQETVYDSEVSIEHVFPQKPKGESVAEFAAPNDGKDYTHLLGNLTFTKKNQEMGNRTFSQKRAIGFNDSPYHLNDYIRKQEKWTYKQVLERTRLLGKDFIKIYPSIEDFNS